MLLRMKKILLNIMKRKQSDILKYGKLYIHYNWIKKINLCYNKKYK